MDSKFLTAVGKNKNYGSDHNIGQNLGKMITYQTKKYYK